MAGTPGPASLTWKTDFSAWARGTAVLRQRIAMEAEESAKRILADAVDQAPERSGDLKNSGRVVRRGEMSFSVEFGHGLPDGRAVYQEYGTSHHAAQPYLTPAVVSEQPVFIRRLAITTQGRVASFDSGIQGSSGLGITA